PTYFGGFLNDNFEALHQSLGIDEKTIRTLVANSFKASFLPQEQKKQLVEKVLSA
ncbi:MAG TPA: adenosine deaminase, partial [Alteromonas macleodii]|nr:adenosine deaminase [Alteromonas macleodii]